MVKQQSFRMKPTPCSDRFPATLLVSLVSALLLLLSPVGATPLATNSSTITAVTLYPSSALVSRQLTVDLPRGEHRLLVDLPRSVQRQGMTAQPLQPGLRVRAIRFIEIDTVEDRQARRQTLLTAYRKLQQDQALLNAELAAIDRQLALIATFVSARDGDAVFTPDNFVKAISQVGEQEVALRKRQVGLRGSIDEAQRELDTLKRQMDRLGRAIPKQFQAELTVYAEQPFQGAILFDYQVNQVQWSPVIAAELDSEAQRLSLVLQADVQQQSGEAWPSVKLTLANTRPLHALALPSLHSWWLSPASALSRRDSTRKAEGVAFSDAIAEAEEQATPTPVEAQVKQSAFSFSFVLPGTTSLETGDTPQRVRVQQYDAPASVSLRILPSQYQQAFVYAAFDAPADYPLQAGMWELSRDGQYVGQHRMPLIAPGEAIELPLGSDDRVSVRRTQVADKITESGMITSTETLHRRYQVQISSGHRQPRQLSIIERIPVSRHEDIKVSLDRQTPSPTRRDVDDIPGVLAWDMTLPPGDDIALGIGYQVQYPAGKPPEGL